MKIVGMLQSDDKSDNNFSTQGAKAPLPHKLSFKKYTDFVCDCIFIKTTSYRINVTFNLYLICLSPGCF